MKLYKTWLIALILGLPVMVGCSDDVDIPAMPVVEELPDWEDNVSGEIYDYTVTMEPERPYMLEYEKTMTYKLFMARPEANNTGNSIVNMTFAQALEVIKSIDNITRGLPKVVYLVGWQYEGHDCKYPAFHEFNKALKRPEDATAAESFYWLQDEAMKYNTRVSVHVNIHDASVNSPLWHEYVKNDLICMDASGKLIPYDVFNGVPCYHVNTSKEWQKGFLQKRLDELVELTRLKEIKTVHFDAFCARESPYHGVTNSIQHIYQRKAIRYMRDKGVDVTIEFWNDGAADRVGQLTGLVPMVWWLNTSSSERAVLPCTLLTGGSSGTVGEVFWYPERFLFGDNYHVENDFNWVDTGSNPHYDATAYKVVKHGVATQTVPYMYYNTHKVVSYNTTKQTVTYSDGLVANYQDQTVRKNGVLLRQGENTFYPLPWITDHKEILAYSKTGYSRKQWTLPADWGEVSEVKVFNVDENGLGEAVTLPVENGKITLSLDPYQAISIQAD